MTASSPLMSTYPPAPVTFVRGEGSWLYDDTGRAYLDLLSGLAVTSLGHSHPDVADALAEQARTRLAAIGGEPEVPESVLDPILDKLPESAERRAIAQVPMIHDDQTRMASATSDLPQQSGGDAESGATIRR